MTSWSRPLASHLKKVRDSEVAVQQRYRLVEGLVREDRGARKRLDALPDPIFEVDGHGRLLYVNRAWEKLVKIRRQDALGNSLAQFVHESDSPTLARGLRSPAACSLTLRLRKKGGAMVHVEIFLGPRREGRVVGRMSELASSPVTPSPVDSDCLLGLFELAIDPMCVLGGDSEILLGNRALSLALGCSEDRFRGRLLHSFIIDDDQDIFLSSLRQLNFGAASSRCEVRLISGDLHLRTFALSLTLEPIENRVHVIGRDCSDNVIEKRELERRCSEDTLTGLHNRSGFLEKTGLRLQTSNRRQKFALLFLDLNSFKPVNDLFGHKAGDEILAESAKRLSSCVRRTDLVGRLGGDEFVICAEIQQRNDAVLIAQKIESAFAVPFHIADVQHKVGISIGVALFPEQSRCLSTLVELADAAMYQAKSSQTANSYFIAEDPNEATQLRRFRNVDNFRNSQTVRPEVIPLHPEGTATAEGAFLPSLSRSDDPEEQLEESNAWSITDY